LLFLQAEVFLKQVTNFTGEHIDPDAMHRLQAIINDPMFNFEKLESKSEAAAHLCNWVIHIYEFHRTYRRVAPLMMQLATAQEDQAQAESDLESIEGDLRKIDKKLALYKVLLHVLVLLFFSLGYPYLVVKFRIILSILYRCFRSFKP
jgi:dynein heavy chain